MTRILQLVAVLLLVAMPALAEWPAESAAVGARDNPAVLQRYGGAVRNPVLSAYVANIGAQLVAVSNRPGERWQFTVLDSPEVNAFALPGGYIYVTRGLLALVNNESELAAVLAHEITHVVQAHIEAREEAQKDALVDGALNALVTGLFGGGENRVDDAVRSGVETVFSQVGAYSRAQEFEADAGGIQLLRAAGYRPAAQADFLASMAAYAALKAREAGREYDESRAPFFANHPAPAERQLKARALAGREDGRTGVDSYLSAIDGMIYGQNQHGGFVQGQRFIHPELGFSFEAAAGLRIQNAARQINILGPGRATLIMSGGEDSADLRTALQMWAAQIPIQDRPGRRMTDVHRLEINGLAAATGTVSLRKRGRPSILRLTVIRFGGGLIRFAGTVPRGDETAADLQWQTVQSFGPLDGAETIEPAKYIAIHPVRAGQTVARLVANSGVHGFSEAEFRVLNGMEEGDDLQAGQLVKLVTY